MIYTIKDAIAIGLVVSGLMIMFGVVIYEWWRWYKGQVDGMVDEKKGFVIQYMPERAGYVLMHTQDPWYDPDYVKIDVDGNRLDHKWKRKEN